MPATGVLGYCYLSVSSLGIDVSHRYCCISTLATSVITTKMLACLLTALSNTASTALAHQLQLLSYATTELECLLQASSLIDAGLTANTALAMLSIGLIQLHNHSVSTLTTN